MQHIAFAFRPHRGFSDGAGIDARLGAHGLNLRAQKRVLILVEVEQGSREQRRRQRIQQQNAPKQRRKTALCLFRLSLSFGKAIERRGGIGHAVSLTRNARQGNHALLINPYE